MFRGYLGLRAGVAGALIVAGLALTAGSLLGWSEARAFARDADRAEAIVVGSIPWYQGPDEADRVTVEFAAGGRTVRANAPAFDRAHYATGSRVEVLYDPREPNRVRLARERYDLSWPLTFAALLAGVGVGLLAWSLSWIVRVQRLAASPVAGFAMRAALEPAHDRLDLLPLDPAAREPVVSVPLMRGQIPASVMWSEAELHPFDVVVKGMIRDGGVIVAHGRARVWWPKRRARVPKPD